MIRAIILAQNSKKIFLQNTDHLHKPIINIIENNRNIYLGRVLSDKMLAVVKAGKIPKFEMI